MGRNNNKDWSRCNAGGESLLVITQNDSTCGGAQQSEYGIWEDSTYDKVTYILQ